MQKLKKQGRAVSRQVRLENRPRRKHGEVKVARDLAARTIGGHLRYLLDNEARGRGGSREPLYWQRERAAGFCLGWLEWVAVVSRIDSDTLSVCVSAVALGSGVQALVSAEISADR